MKGVIVRVGQVTEEYERRRTSALIDFREKSVTLVKIYPQIAKFPFPIQKKIAKQHEKARKRYHEGKEPQLWLNTPACNCDFYMAYFLPCAHIFLCDMIYSLKTQLTDEIPSTIEKRNKFLQEYRNFADRLKELSLEDSVEEHADRNSKSNSKKTKRVRKNL